MRHSVILNKYKHWPRWKKEAAGVPFVHLINNMALVTQLFIRFNVVS